MEHTDHPHGAPAGEHSGAHAPGQQHPLGVYFKIWGLLFVLSAASYMVDYFKLQGLLRWSLIIVFMLLKAGLIVSVFMLGLLPFTLFYVLLRGYYALEDTRTPFWITVGLSHPQRLWSWISDEPRTRGLL